MLILKTGFALLGAVLLSAAFITIGFMATGHSAAAPQGKYEKQKDMAVQDNIVAVRLKAINEARILAPDMPREAMRGYPVPVMRNGQISLAVPFFLRRGQSPQPPALSAPGWIAYIDLATGEDITVIRTDESLEKTLGTHTITPPLDMAEFRGAETELLRIISALLPIAEHPEEGVPDALAGEAAAFRVLWPQLSHAPLAPYYRRLNPDWFTALATN